MLRRLRRELVCLHCFASSCVAVGKEKGLRVLPVPQLEPVSTNTTASRALPRQLSGGHDPPAGDGSMRSLAGVCGRPGPRRDRRAPMMAPDEASWERQHVKIKGIKRLDPPAVLFQVSLVTPGLYSSPVTPPDEIIKGSSVPIRLSLSGRVAMPERCGSSLWSVRWKARAQHEPVGYIRVVHGCWGRAGGCCWRQGGVWKERRGRNNST